METVKPLSEWTNEEIRAEIARLRERRSIASERPARASRSSNSEPKPRGRKVREVESDGLDDDFDE